MPTPPCQPPGAQPPGAQPPGARPDSGPGSRRRGCPRLPGPPLPDPDGVRLWPVPDSAPPYDDELLPRPAWPADPGRPAETASRPAACAGQAQAGQQEQPGGQDRAGGQDQAGDGQGEDQPGQEHRPEDDAPPRPGGPLRPADGAWPGQFAQVLVETLAGSRPPRQISSWATERARARIQRLGPMLAAGHRPQLRRVVAFRPASDVIEMTVVVSFGPRVRALAIRLEHSPPGRALPGRQPGKARWLCTEVEAA
jgi:Family of unknown function (DUF6459)